MTRAKEKKFWSSKFQKWVLVNGNFVKIRLDSLSGHWKDDSGKRFDQQEDGSFIEHKEHEPELVGVPEGVVPKYGESFTLNGIIYQFQPKGPKGELIPVSVGKIAPVVSLGMGGSRVHTPAHAVRTK